MSHKSSITKTTELDKYWVIIGASAGGLEALKEFLKNFKSFDDCYLIIAQHLDPKHPTILSELLGRITDTPVSLLTQDTKPKTGRIYIVSPGHNAIIEDKKIKLSPAAEIGPKPSVDLLLKSAARDINEQLVAVILSGTGSDGAQGVIDVKNHNGLVFVQDKKTAKYSGMPDAALETRVVDMALPPEEIAQQVSHFIKYLRLDVNNEMIIPEQSDLDKVFKALFEQTGYDFSGYKHKTIFRRLNRRIAVHKLSSIKDYLVYLQSSPQEADSLFRDLLISVTDFFRDEEHFMQLNKVIEARLEELDSADSFRVWVPGCANGEEAFSIAILIHKACIKHNKIIDYQIFATDIDEGALNNGRKAYYSASQLENLDDDTRERFFTHKNGSYLVNKKIRERVLFAKHNLVMDPPFSKIDLISCRNLLIYFTSELQKQIFHTFHFALNSNGILFLGKSESPLNICPELYKNKIRRSPIFERKQIEISDREDYIQSANNFAKQRRTKVKFPTIKSRSLPSAVESEKDVFATLESQLFRTFIPAAVIVDSSGMIVNLQGNVNDYLSFPQGKASMNILSLARDEYKIDLRVLLQRAQKEKSAFAPVLNLKDKGESLLIRVESLKEIDSQSDFFAIGFFPIPFNGFLADDDQASKIFSDKEANRILRLEVDKFKERLQTTIEELETTNEELQSTNEELQSANEELQSANEELQTSNEEMQSTNQELSTVNEELEIKSFELEQVNHDLESMLENMSESILLIDNRLRLLRWTKEASKLLHLNSDHINQTITTIGIPVDVPDLRQNLLEVIETQIPKQIRVRNQDKVYNLRIEPHFSENQILSGILIFFDETFVESIRNNQKIDCHINFRILGDQIEQALVVIDFQGVITYMNDLALDITGYKEDQLIYKNISLLMPEPFASHHDSYLHDYQSGKTSGIIGKWRDITILTADNSKVLCLLKVEPTWVNMERHFIGFIKVKEN